MKRSCIRRLVSFDLISPNNLIFYICFKDSKFIQRNLGEGSNAKVRGDDQNPQRNCAQEIRTNLKSPTELIELDAHINDRAFVDQALAVLDQWVVEGTVPVGKEPA